MRPFKFTTLILFVLILLPCARSNAEPVIDKVSISGSGCETSDPDSVEVTYGPTSKRVTISMDEMDIVTDKAGTFTLECKVQFRLKSPGSRLVMRDPSIWGTSTLDPTTFMRVTASFATPTRAAPLVLQKDFGGVRTVDDPWNTFSSEQASLDPCGFHSQVTVTTTLTIITTKNTADQGNVEASFHLDEVACPGATPPALPPRRPKPPPSALES